MSDETPETDVERMSQEGEGSEFDTLAREIEQNPGGPAFPRLAEAYRRAGQIARAETIARQGLTEAPDRMSGRVALALTMLDKGEVDQAMDELSSIMENIPNLPSEAAEPAATIDPGSSLGEHRLYSEPLAAPSAALPTFAEADREAGHRAAESSSDGERGGNENAEANEANDFSREPSDRHPVSGVELHEDEIDDAIDSAQAEEDQMVSANRMAEAALREIADSDTDEAYSPSAQPVFTTETMAGLLEGQGDHAAAQRVRASIPSLDAAEEPATDASSTSAPERMRPARVAPAFRVESLHGDPPEPDPATLSDAPQVAAEAVRQERIIQRLESWIENVRRKVA